MFRVLIRFRWRGRAPTDVGGASECELHAFVGRAVAFNGRVFLAGHQGPFVLVGDCPIYLNQHGDRAAVRAWRQSLERLDGRAVRVAGRLLWQSNAVPGSHFYFYLDRGARLRERGTP